MKIISTWAIWVVIGLVFFGTQLDAVADCLQPTDVQVTREPTQGKIIKPNTGPASPHPNLTGEQIDEGMRLKRKGAYPWHVDTYISVPLDPSESSDENTAPASGNNGRQAVE